MVAEIYVTKELKEVMKKGTNFVDYKTVKKIIVIFPQFFENELLEQSTIFFLFYAHNQGYNIHFSGNDQRGTS